MTGWVVARATIHQDHNPRRPLHVIEDKVYHADELTPTRAFIICEDGERRPGRLSDQLRLLSPLELLARQINTDDLA